MSPRAIVFQLAAGLAQLQAIRRPLCDNLQLRINEVIL